MQVLFVGPLIALFWTSGDRLPWVSKPGWDTSFAYFIVLYAMDSSDSPIV